MEKWSFCGLEGQGGIHFRKETEHQLEREDCLHFPLEMSLFSDMEITTSNTSILFGNFRLIVSDTHSVPISVSTFTFTSQQGRITLLSLFSSEEGMLRDSPEVMQEACTTMRSRTHVPHILRHIP